MVQAGAWKANKMQGIDVLYENIAASELNGSPAPTE